MIPEWLLPVLVGGAVQGLITWGALRVEMLYLRRDVNDAHARLNAINAPAAPVR